MNYNARAKKLANYVHSRRLATHRGVMPLAALDACVVFGNDNYSHNPHTHEMVRLLFDACHEAGVPVLGFATNDGDEANDAGCSWALVLGTDNADWAKARLHDAFFESHGLYAPRSLVLAAADDGHWRAPTNIASSTTISLEKPR